MTGKLHFISELTLLRMANLAQRALRESPGADHWKEDVEEFVALVGVIRSGDEVKITQT